VRPPLTISPPTSFSRNLPARALSVVDMRSGLLLTNGIVLAGIAWALAIGPGTHSKSLLSPTSAKDAPGSAAMAELEARAAHHPSVDSITALASAYVDQGQPGLASAVIEKAPRAIQVDPRVADVHARALFHRGHARQALATLEDALEACETNHGSCRSWQIAKADRQAAFLHAVVAAGIEDPMTDPAGVRAAYERASLEAGVVAMR